MKFDSGTSPSGVRTLRLSRVDSTRSSSGKRTGMSISSSEESTRMVPMTSPRVTS